MVNIHIKITSDCAMQNQYCDWLCKKIVSIRDEHQGECDAGGSKYALQ
jgi:hypothetical protein